MNFSNVDELVKALDGADATKVAEFLNLIIRRTRENQGLMMRDSEKILSMEQFREHLKRVTAEKILEYLESAANSGAFCESDKFVFENAHGNLSSDSDVGYVMEQTGRIDLLESMADPDGSINIKEIQERLGIPGHAIEGIF